MSCAKFPGTDMEEVHKSLKMQHEAQRLWVLAPDYDRVRRDFNCGLADEMEREARGLLMPAKPLERGLGGEIIPTAASDLSDIIQFTLAVNERK